MNRVLIVAYFFPPDGGAGTQRAAKFCKYLPQFGWRPYVLTRRADVDRISWNPSDNSLLDQTVSDLPIYRVAPSAEKTWSETLPHIDMARDWLEPACAAAQEIVGREKIDAILITMSPFDLCFLGQQLRKTTGVPVIYDLRDPWALDGVRVYGTKARWRRDFDAMLQTLGPADGVVANTPESSKALLAAMPGLKAERVATIPNGYDAEDFAGIRTPAPSSDALNLVHTGTFLCDSLYAYRGLVGLAKRLRHYRAEPLDPSGRTPLHLLRAIKLLTDKGDPAGRNTRLISIGNLDEFTRRCVEDSGMAHQVDLVGYAPHSESVARVQSADALFLHLHGLPPGRRSLIVPGKTYEYLASGRPILACLPQGDARELVERSRRGYCANPCDPSDIAKALSRLYADHKSSTASQITDNTWLSAYERRQLTGRLAEFLNSIIARPAHFSASGQLLPRKSIAQTAGLN